ncbi:MAG TPA: hypothetical protein DCY42_03230 [Chloroflexi bacterium]|nr:hypothetical protein [Chloroflexota bacterium]
MTELKALWDAEVAEFEGGYYRWAIGLANTILDKWAEEYPYMYSNRADSYANLGDFDLAIKDLETAAKLPYMKEFKHSMENPDIGEFIYTEDEINTIANLYNNLCWYLAITNQPDRALPYCEEAVELFPSIVILDSRAVVYAMLGKTEEAISDFEQVFALAEDDPFGFYTDLVDERKLWATALQNGEDPFTPEVLEILKQETIDPDAYPDPELLEDFSGQHFTKILEQDGFVLVDSGVNDSGVEYKFYGLVAGECMIRVVLFDPDQEFTQAKMILNGCSDEQYLAELRWFVKFLLWEDPRADADCVYLGQWRGWELTMLPKLMTGEVQATDEFKLRDVKFVAEHELDQEGNNWITLYGYK